MLKLVSEILRFLQIQENQQENSISGILWAFKCKLQIIQAGPNIALFIPDSNNCFFIYLVTYTHICIYYFLILCLCFFHLLLLTPLATRHILQLAMFDSISLQPARNITEVKILYSPRQKKKMRVNYSQTKCPNILIVQKVWVFS